MFKRTCIVVGLVLFTLLLAACQPSTTATTVAATPAVNSAPTDYIAPANESLEGELGVTMDGVYPVLPGDESKVGGNFFPDLIQLRPNATDAKKTDLYVNGTLPTPCNEIRAYMNPPDANNQIYVQVYSVADGDKVCTQVLQPYEGVVLTFADIPTGTYQVSVNGQIVGDLTMP